MDGVAERFWRENFYPRTFTENFLLKVEGRNELVFENGVFIGRLYLALRAVERQRFIVFDLTGFDLQLNGFRLAIVYDDPEIMAEELVGLELLGNLECILCLIDCSDSIEGVDARLFVGFASGKKIPALLEEL